MARPASRGSIGTDGTRFGDGPLGAEVSAPERLKLELGVGSVIDGKYRLEGLLGEGGMGAVWWAHHLELDLPVAIKLLRADTDQTTLSERLKIEARAVAQLVHPAIVRVFDMDRSERGEPFIVMELLRGESLADLLDRGRLSQENAVQIALPIAEALALAHAKGVVHRDLKPHNVFLAEEAEKLQPKLLDFGIAKLMAPGGTNGSLTETGISVGSPDYMSPEQARGSNDVDHRADIWAFCVMLYEALTCLTPFRGDNYNALMRSIVENEPLPLDESVEPRLAELVAWGLCKERSDRPSTIQELGRELARWLIARGVTADICGTPLEAKWISRLPQKSVPLLVEPVEAPKLLPLRTDTLVSARLSNAGGVEPRGAENAVIPAALPNRGRTWALAAAVLALGGVITWALVGKSGSPSPTAVSGAVADRPPATAPPAAVSPTTPPVAVEIASSAPGPAPPAATQPPTVHSASPLPSRTPGSKARDAGKPASAAQPARDVHDETHELLQAY